MTYSAWPPAPTAVEAWAVIVVLTFAACVGWALDAVDAIKAGRR